jgi:hypothetical protein
MGLHLATEAADGVNHPGIPHVLSMYLTVAWIWVRSAGVAGDGKSQSLQWPNQAEDRSL